MQVLKNEVQDRIIAAATDEFTDKGYRQASLRSIAQAAGTSVSNVYHYYPDKEALFRHIAAPLYDAVMELAERISAAVHPDRTALNHMIDTMTAFLESKTEIERKIIVMLAEKSEGTKYEDTKRRMIELLKTHFTDQLQPPGGAGNQVSCDRNAVFAIIAENFVNGIIRIIEQRGGGLSAAACFRAFLEYHSFGIGGMTMWDMPII